MRNVDKALGYCAGFSECATRRCLAQLIVVTSRGNESDVMRDQSPELPLSAPCGPSNLSRADVRRRASSLSLGLVTDDATAPKGLNRSTITAIPSVASGRRQSAARYFSLQFA